MNNDSKSLKTNNNTCLNYENSNIDLQQIVNVLKKDWKILLIIILFFTLSSFFVSFFLPKKYKATTVFLPPSAHIVNRLNSFKNYVSPDSGKDPFQVSIEQLYLLFLDNLRSSDLRYKFLEEKKILSASKKSDVDQNKYKLFSDEFNGKIKVIYTGTAIASDSKFIKVELVGSDPVFISEALNQYVSYIDRETIKYIVDAIKEKVTVEKYAIENKIKSLRDVAEKNRINLISQISEDSDIAEKINIIDPVNTTIASYKQIIDEKSGIIQSSRDVPGYMKGVKALKAELYAVTNRKNNDPFIPELQQLLVQEEYLEGILKLSFEDVHAARIDQVAFPPEEPVQPKKILIICVGMAFGLLLSMFIILIKVVISKSR